MKACNGKDQQEKETSLKPEVPLQNPFTALQTEEERPITSGELLGLNNAVQRAPCATTSAAKKMPQVGNSRQLCQNLWRHPFGSLKCSLERGAACLQLVSGTALRLQSRADSWLLSAAVVSHGHQGCNQSSLRSIKKD